MSSAAAPIYRALLPHEKAECLDLWLGAWPGERNDAYFGRYFSGDVEWLPYYTQVAEVDGKLASVVQICKRVVSCGEFSLVMGGIANVVTLPAFQGCGYNTGCMKRAISVMEADAMDFSLLFTGINDYYKRFGYEELPRRRVEVTVDKARLFEPNGIVVRPAQPHDLAAIREIYDRYNAERPIAVHRSESYWRDWLRVNPLAPPEDLLVAIDASGRVAGYIFSGLFNSAIPYSSADESVRAIEFGVSAAVVEHETAVTAALICAIVRNLPDTTNPVLILEIAFTPTVVRVISDLAEPDGIRDSVSMNGMARVLHRDNLLRSLAMVRSEGWMACGAPEGSLTFETPYGLARIEASGGQLSVVPVDNSSGDGVIPHASLLGLLVGSVKATEVETEVGTSDLLTALFPERDTVFWGADGF